MNNVYEYFLQIMLVVWVVGFDFLEKIIQENVHINIWNYAFWASCQTFVNFLGVDMKMTEGYKFFSFFSWSWWANNFRGKKDLYESWVQIIQIQSK